MKVIAVERNKDKYIVKLSELDGDYLVKVKMLPMTNNVNKNTLEFYYNTIYFNLVDAVRDQGYDVILEE